MCQDITKPNLIEQTTIIFRPEGAPIPIQGVRELKLRITPVEHIIMVVADLSIVEAEGASTIITREVKRHMCLNVIKNNN